MFKYQQNVTALDLQVLCAPTVYICKQNRIVAIVFNKVWAVYAVEESIEAGSRSSLVAGYRGQMWSIDSICKYLADANEL